MRRDRSGENGNVRVMISFAVLLMAAGFLAWYQFRKPAPQAPPAAGGAASDTASSDADIAQALRQAGATPKPDSTAIKSAWHDDISGVDVTGLTPKQHDIFLRYANSERCTCGCGYTLAGCKASDMSCEVSGSAIAALLDSVRSGQIRSARGLRERPARD
jgi:hypothetical protein